MSGNTFNISTCGKCKYKSGETGIRTLGTLAGTPVFKTGLDLTQPLTQPGVTKKDHIRGARIGAELSGASFLGAASSFWFQRCPNFPVNIRFPLLENMP